MSSNQKDSYWEVGSLGEGRSFGLALTDSGGAVTGGGGDSKAKVLQRVRKDATVSLQGDMGDNSVRGIKRSLKIMKGSDKKEKKESDSKSENEKVEEAKALPDIPDSLPDKVKNTLPFPTVAEQKRKMDLAQWKTR